VNLFFNQMIFKYTKFPKAAKDFLRFMMEKEQFDAVAGRVDRLFQPAAEGLREQQDLDGRPEAHAVPRHHQEHAVDRLFRRKPGYASAGRAGRLRHGQHGGRGGLAARRRPRKPPSAPRSGPSATTRSDA
jgi:hypothetical protein